MECKGSRNLMYELVLYKKYIKHALHDPVTMENPTMPNMHITKDEWHNYGNQLTSKQIPIYCQYCNDYQVDKVPRCNKCRIQTTHDLRTAKYPQIESYCKYCTEWLIERADDNAYDPCHECQIQYYETEERESTSLISSSTEEN